MTSRLGFGEENHPTFANSAASSAICAFSSVTCHVSLVYSRSVTCMTPKSLKEAKQLHIATQPASWLVAGSSYRPRCLMQKTLGCLKVILGRVGRGEAKNFAHQTIQRHLWDLHVLHRCELRCRVSPCSQLPRGAQFKLPNIVPAFSVSLKARVIRFCIQVEM